MANARRHRLPSEEMIDTIEYSIRNEKHASDSRVMALVHEAVIKYCSFLYSSLTGILKGRLECGIADCTNPEEKIAKIRKVLKIATAFAHLDRTTTDKDHALSIAEATLTKVQGKGFVHLPYQGAIELGLRELNTGYEAEKVGWSNGHGYFAHKKHTHEKFPILPRNITDACYLKQPSSMVSVGLLRKALAEEVLFVIDMCAAPGGKSIELIAALHNRNARILCNDISGDRMKIMRNIFRKSQTEKANVAISYDTLDGERMAKQMPNSADIVMCDVPCSGVGNLHQDEFMLPALNFSEANALKQQALLDAAIRTVKPAGHIVYSTCTLSGCENEGVVAAMQSKWGSSIEILDPRGVLESSEHWPIDSAVQASLKVQNEFHKAHHTNPKIRNPFPAVRLDGLTSPGRSTGFFAALIRKKRDGKNE